MSVFSVDDVLAILSSITQITADSSAQQLECPEFYVTLKFSRSELRRNHVAAFADQEPWPTELFASTLEHLRKLQTQQAREKNWSAKIGPGATLVDCIAFLEGEILRNQNFNGIADGITRQYQRRTLQHLQELIERRGVGGYRNPQEERQNADSAKWRFEDSSAAEALRKEQERMQERASRQRQKRNAYEQYKQAFDEALYRDFADSLFNGDGRKQQAPPPPPPRSNSKPTWYNVLGVRPNATQEEIMKATRRLRAKYHPDRCKDADAQERIKDINVACDQGLQGATR